MRQFKAIVVGYSPIVSEAGRVFGLRPVFTLHQVSAPHLHKFRLGNRPQHASY